MPRKVYNFNPCKDLQIGSKFILKEFIDQGTFGTVWKAVNLETEEIVALKIPKEQEKSDNTLSEGKKLIGEKHPNIIELKWMGRVDGVFLIEMEYFEGYKLSNDLTETGFKNPKPFEKIYDLFFQIMNGIEFMHGKQISHGDIKPQNILIKSNLAKITDFGTSKFVEDSFVYSNADGTWAYIAPEIIGSNKRYLNSDIYSLGVLLYQMLTGRTPHKTPIQIINNISYPKPREINVNISPQLEEVILKALERNPENRFQNLNEFKEAVKKEINTNPHVISVQTKEEMRKQDWLDYLIKLFKKIDYIKAEAFLLNEISSGDFTPDHFYYLAFIYFKQKRFFDSIEQINKIELNSVENIRTDAFKENITFLKAKVYRELKYYDKAVTLFENLVNMNEDNINYRYQLACLYGLNNNEDKAIEIFENINTQNPAIPSIIEKLGFAYDQKKDYFKARSFFKYALTLSPNTKNIQLINEKLNSYKLYL